MTMEVGLWLEEIGKVRTNGIFYLSFNSQLFDFTIYCQKIDVVYFEGILLEMLKAFSIHPRHGGLIASYIEG